MSSGRVEKKAIQADVKNVGSLSLRNLKLKHKEMSSRRVEKKVVRVDVKNVGSLSLTNPKLKRKEMSSNLLKHKEMSTSTVEKKAVQVNVKDVGDLSLRNPKLKHKEMSSDRVKKKTVRVDVKNVGSLSLTNPKLKRKEMSSNSVEKKVVQVNVKDLGDLSLRNLKRKNKEIGETSLAHCGICMDAKPGKEMFKNQNCSHLYCDYCIGRHVAAKIQENILMVKCPEPKCKAVIEPNNCRSIIPKEVFDRWGNALCENAVLGSQKFYCPFKDCSAMMICDEGEVVTSSECPHCHRLFCAQCKVSWHAGIDCEEFQRSKRKKGENGGSLVIELAKTKHVAMNFAMLVDCLGLLNIIRV
ncbi:hypothetical protein V8G54_002861 [Vigna mungo]|uniref:RBR-type E3 ubiquitin transferase n=1 Tax=Vigna mungo TaxID=3915 RepID=A0AAQ3SB77_VIGMU